MLDKNVIKELLEENLAEIKIPKHISKENLFQAFCNYVEDDYYEWLNDNYKDFFNHGNPDWSWIKERTECNL
ncbi:MAG: hypothetical protein AB7E45_00530 [Candidatus Caldatribacteriota bacterium]